MSINTVSRLAEVSKISTKKLEWWPFDQVGPKIKKRIKFEALYINTFFVINSVMGFVSGVLHVIPLEDDKELFYPLAIFEQFAPKWQFWLEWLYRMSFLLIPFIMAGPSYIGIYLSSRFRFQFYLFNEYLKNINYLNDNQQTPDFIENKDYQKKIKKRLIFCIKRNIHLYEQVFFKNFI